MVELRIERENRMARLYFIQGICVKKRGKIWIADVLLKEVRLRDNTKAVGILHKGQLFRPEIRSWRCLVTRERETTWRCRKIC